RIGLPGYGALDLVAFVVFGEYRHRYAISSLMDMVYWLIPAFVSSSTSLQAAVLRSRPKPLLFCLISLSWLYLFNLCSVLKGFPLTVMVLGIPVISAWVYAKTSALALKRSRSPSLKCPGSCFPIVTACSGYLLLTTTFSYTVMQLKTPFSLAGGVSLIFFIPSFTLSDSYVENTVPIPLVVWNLIAP
ncbi:hypothetical protein Tco_0805330, partial [Tanacetum coccineum]